MEPKTNRLITIIATIVPALLIALSASGKLSRPEMVVQGFTKLGVVQHLPELGAAEIVFAILFIFPKTMKLGFLLLSCYFSGAMATELSHGMTPFSPAIVLIIVWIAAFVKDKSIFLSSTRSS